jgi:hypothetical protein
MPSEELQFDKYGCLDNPKCVTIERLCRMQE